MVTFIHTGDVHLGLRVTRFEQDRAEKIREARFRAVERIIAAARDRQADFILIAGDLFDDASVDLITAGRALSLLQSAPCPVYVIPGNHDPLLPGSVWDRPPWNGETDSVHVCREREPARIAEDVTLFPCPVFRKTSIDDPTEWIEKPPAADGFRIGMAHGSVQDRETLSGDDHPIPLDAAEQRGLDYIALGHWHSMRQYNGADEAVRMAYCGTPEPIGWPGAGADAAIGWVPYSLGEAEDHFASQRQGKVLCVTVDAPGAATQIQQLDVNVLNWSDRTFVLHEAADVDAATRQLAEVPDPERCVLRLQLQGVLPAGAMLRVEALRQLVTGRCLHAEIDRTRLLLKPSEEEIQEIIGHGVLRQVYERLAAELQHEQEQIEAQTEQQQTAPVAERAMMILYQMASEVKS